MIIRFFSPLNSFEKVMLLLLALVLLAPCYPAFAMDEYSPFAEKLTQAEDLELMAGKSFVLECYEKVVRVAVGNPKIADVRALNQEKVLINAVRPGTTNLIVWHADDTTEIYNLTVKYDVSEIRKKLKEVVPEADITVSTSFAMLMVDGCVEDQETMNRVMNVLQAFANRDYIKNLMTLKGPQQVQLEVKIAEISRSDIKKFGLGWLSNRSASGHQVGLGVFQSGSVSGSLSGGRTTEADLGSGQLSYAMELASPFTDAFQVAVSVLDKDIMSIISLLKSQGVAHILARPNLVAMSGQQAQFLVGGEFPVPTENDGETDIDYKNFGVMLEFIPTVIGKETVNLEVTTSVSDIDYSTTVSSGGVTVPGLTTREASTTLQLKDGQTFAIAGLLKETINSVVNKIPFLGDIPLIGVLFRSKEYIKEETELIMLVTPRLVKPMNPGEIPPLPGENEDGNQSDFEFFLLDRIWKKKTSNPEKIPRFSGPMGFEK
jgi:pilus assembly protein CpaC